MPVAKEQIRQIIADNNLSSVADVYSLLRDSFKDILQELIEYSVRIMQLFRTFSAGHPEIRCSDSGCQCSPL